MTVNENSISGRDAALKAFRESQRSTKKTDGLIADLATEVAKVREARERNHFRDKLVKIIRGAAA